MTKKTILLSLALVATATSISAPIREDLAAKSIDYSDSFSLDMVPVAYLEADGNSYIDTGIYGSSALNYSVVFSVEESGNFIYGCWDSSSNNSRQDLFVFANNFLVYVGNGGVNQAINRISPSVVYSAEQVDGTVTVNGLRRSFTDDMSLDRTWFLFGCNRGSIKYMSLPGTRIYSATIYLGDSLLADFRPVRFVNSRGEMEGGMLDKVSGIVFTNSGSGSFLIGPDL